MADVDDLLNPCVHSSLDQGVGILDGPLECHWPSLKADPVGVVQRVCALEASGQRYPVVEVQRGHTHSLAEWVGTVWVPGQGFHPLGHRRAAGPRCTCR